MHHFIFVMFCPLKKKAISILKSELDIRKNFILYHFYIKCVVFINYLTLLEKIHVPSQREKENLFFQLYMTVRFPVLKEGRRKQAISEQNNSAFHFFWMKCIYFEHYIHTKMGLMLQ